VDSVIHLMTPPLSTSRPGVTFGMIRMIGILWRPNKKVEVERILRELRSIPGCGRHFNAPAAKRIYEFEC
jgi:hypothetical protein